MSSNPSNTRGSNHPKTVWPASRIEAAGSNSLDIMYPAATDLLPLGIPVTVWVRYLDGNGQPKKNEPIRVAGGKYDTVNPGDIKTDDDGWATTQFTSNKPDSLGHPGSYSTVISALDVNNTNDRDQVFPRVSTAAGGPFVITLDDTVLGYDPKPSSTIVGGEWTLIIGVHCFIPPGSPFRQKNYEHRPGTVCSPG